LCVWCWKEYATITGIKFDFFGGLFGEELAEQSDQKHRMHHFLLKERGEKPPQNQQS
jgi:hypothetical protein